jgi:Bacterial PH domain
MRAQADNGWRLNCFCGLGKLSEQKKKQRGKPIAGAIVYRSSRAMRLFLVFGLVAMSASAWSLVQKDGLTWLSAASIGLALFFVAGVGDGYTSRVTLTEEAIEIRSNFRRRTFPREAFTGVHWAKGCPVTLSLVAGGKVELPHCGSPNTLRAWLKRGSLG